MDSQRSIAAMVAGWVDFGPGGHGAWATSAAYRLATGPRAQVSVWRPAAGCFHLYAKYTVEQYTL
jgi:hypothetical protein